jgi:hypothetical protein
MEENISYCMSWIRDHEDNLISKYNGKYILVKDKKVRSVCESKQEIVRRGIKRFGRGNFIAYHAVNNNVLEQLAKENEVLLGDLKDFLK